MVRLIPVEHPRRGVVWVEDAPDTCPAGHPDPLPGWGPCPGCRQHLRTWRCRDDACGATAIDDEHRCGQTGSHS